MGMSHSITLNKQAVQLKDTVRPTFWSAGGSVQQSSFFLRVF